MRHGDLKITRETPDKLDVQVWGFKQHWPEPHQLRTGDSQVLLELVSYFHGIRPSKRHRVYQPQKRLLYGTYYVGRQGMQAWFDLTTDGYAWENGDTRWSGSRVTTPPILPQDIEAEAYNAIRPLVRVAQPKREAE